MSDYSPTIKDLENGNLEVTLGDAHLEKVHALLAKHNRRAEREGISQRVGIIRDEVATAKVEGGEVLVHEVEIEVPVLVKDGWKMVAALDFLDSGVIVRTVPGQSLEGWERPEDRICDHCGTKRFRNRSFVVRSDAGETLQVGSSCLTAFIGFSPTMALRWMTFADEISEAADKWGGCYVPRVFPVEQVLRTAYVISDGGKGYVPAGAFERESTSSEVSRVLNFTRGYGPHREQQEREVAAIRAAAEAIPAEEIAAVVEFGKALEGSSDYVQNMLVVLAEDAITNRHVGILGSLVKVWAKDQQREAERKANPVVSEHFGEVKVRIRGLKVTVTKVQCWEGDYGLTTLVVMRTEDGKVAKWFASGSKDIEMGDTLTLDATVKGHDEYEGLKQTVLTRCTVKDRVAA